MRFKGLVTNSSKVLLVVTAIVTVLVCTFTYAESQSQHASRPLEAWEQAQDYSLAHPVIAFAVYGRTKKLTARENAERIRNYFLKQNITSKFFLAKEERMGASVGFYIQGVSYGPIGLAKALPVIQTVAAHYKEEYNIAP